MLLAMPHTHTQSRQTHPNAMRPPLFSLGRIPLVGVAPSQWQTNKRVCVTLIGSITLIYGANVHAITPSSDWDSVWGASTAGLQHLQPLRPHAATHPFALAHLRQRRQEQRLLDSSREFN